MPVRVLTWNLKHGRAVPGVNRHLLDEFAEALAGWKWDLALLQEVPPWWPEALGARLGAVPRLVLTSRNGLLPVRRWLAVRRPELMKSGGGSANAVLVRGGQVEEHLIRRLCRLPERRWVHAVRCVGGPFARGMWAGNLHATAHRPPAAQRDCALAARTLLEWAGRDPCLLGGDFNLRSLELTGFEPAGGHDVDHVFVRGLGSSGGAQVLDRGSLSDHAPVVVSLEGATS